MSINAVTSFRGQDLNSLIAQPPASSISPMAANPIEPDSYEKQGSSFGKKLGVTVLVLGALATALGVLHGKTEMFGKAISGQKWGEVSGIMEKGKWVVAKAGEFVNDYAVKAWNGVKKLFGKGEEVANAPAAPKATN